MNINQIINVRAEFTQAWKTNTLYKVASKYETSFLNPTFYGLFPYSWLHDGYNIRLRDARLIEKSKYKSSLHKCTLTDIQDYLDSKYDYTISYLSRYKGNLTIHFNNGDMLKLYDIMENVKSLQDFKDSYLDYMDISDNENCELWKRDNTISDNEFM